MLPSPCISAHPTSVPRKRQRLQMRSSPASATRPFRHKRAVSRASAPAMGIRVTEKRTGAPRRERDRSGKLMSIGPAIPWEESRPCPSRRSVALGLTKRVSVAPGTGAAGAGADRRPPCSCCDSDGRDAARRCDGLSHNSGGGAGRQLQTLVGPPLRAAMPAEQQRPESTRIAVAPRGVGPPSMSRRRQLIDEAVHFDTSRTTMPCQRRTSPLNHRRLARGKRRDE